VLEDPYSDPDLVQFYDLDNPDGEDHAYYRALADEVRAQRLIDLGCGTGLLTRSLARPGRAVIGVDPSRTMLEYARRQPGAERVAWVQGRASVLAPTGAADLAISTGNAIMHVSPQDLAPTLTSLARALRRGGTLSFETRNPAHREWERWTSEATLGERDTPMGRLREWLDVTEVAGGRVVFDAHNVFENGEHRVYTTHLFFRTADALIRALSSAGFADIMVSGDWHSTPVEDSSRLLVFRAAR
jgi:2-polyprenyl-3-methyl-5-hydroxy-6-metoxy-1,4-benzoquinol methylase